MARMVLTLEIYCSNRVEQKRIELEFIFFILLGLVPIRYSVLLTNM